MAEPRERSNKRIEKNEKKKRFAQAFKQAPWRSRVQSAGLFLLGLVIILLVASVYLSISGQAATAGLDAYRLNLQRLDLERQVADTNAQIAILTSASTMENRAIEMGFERIDPQDAVYITIPGYAGKQTMVVTAPPGVNTTNDQLVKSIYRESLWDWLFSGINALGDSIDGGTR